MFWCQSLGFTCEDQDIQDGGNIDKFVWFENAVATILENLEKEKNKPKSIIILGKANADRSPVWFENTKSNGKVFEGKDPFGRIGFHDGEQFHDLTKEQSETLDF